MKIMELFAKSLDVSTFFRVLSVTYRKPVGGAEAGQWAENTISFYGLKDHPNEWVELINKNKN